jgi:hypothetical protein
LGGAGVGVGEEGFAAWPGGGGGEVAAAAAQ